MSHHKDVQPHYRRPDYETGCGWLFLLAIVYGLLVHALAVYGLLKLIFG